MIYCVVHQKLQGTFLKNLYCEWMYNMDFYPRDVLSGVFATGQCLSVRLSVTAGISEGQIQIAIRFKSWLNHLWRFDLSSKRFDLNVTRFD